MTLKSTAHRYQFINCSKCCRIFLDETCKICHRTKCDDAAVRFKNCFLKKRDGISVERKVFHWLKKAFA